MKLKRKLLIIIMINILPLKNTQKFNKFTAENFAARLVRVNLASKSDISNFVKKRDFDDKLKQFK